MKLTKLVFTIYSVTIISCGQVDPNKQIDEGRVKGEIYESKEIGWSIEIPKDWTIISKDKTEANDQKGKKAIEKSAGIQVDTKGLKHLISFQKNQFNIFASTSELYKEETPGEYQQNNKALNEIIYKTFVDQGIKLDSASGKEIIQGLEFNAFYTTIYTPDGKVILHQILYSRLINGYDFGVNINYNNEQDKKIMIDAWEKSKFTRK
ncbi:MAG TPA: hypothetical protein VHZ50_17980 [Puia sp.]|nr:hypothetical protein [Puia sp.]